MKICFIEKELAVFETNGEESEEELLCGLRESQKEKGFEPWSSAEMEVHTYGDMSIVFAKPIRIYIPRFMSRLAEN